MSGAYLWIKALHIVFAASWFAGLFYLPRLFVNLAMVPALALALCSWLGHGVGSGSGWMRPKRAPVVVKPF